MIRGKIMNRFAAGDLEADLEKTGPIKFRTTLLFESRRGNELVCSAVEALCAASSRLFP